MFYRLYDAVPNKSPWHALNDGKPITLMAKADAILKSVSGLDAKAGEQLRMIMRILSWVYVLVQMHTRLQPATMYWYLIRLREILPIMRLRILRKVTIRHTLTWSAPANLGKKADVGTVYVVVEAINSTDTTNVSELSVIKRYSVAFTVTAGKKILTVQVMALTTGHFGKNTGGNLTADDITYTFYYVNKGKMIGRTIAEATTSAEMYNVYCTKGYFVK